MSLQLLPFCVGILYNHKASTGIFTQIYSIIKVMPNAALVSGHCVNNHRWCFKIILEAFILNALKQFSVVAIELSVSIHRIDF